MALSWCKKAGPGSTDDSLSGNHYPMVLKGPLQVSAPGSYASVPDTFIPQPLQIYVFHTLYVLFFHFIHPEISLPFVFVSLKDKKEIPEIVDPHACLMMVFKTSEYQCFIPAFTESNPSLSQNHPQMNAHGDAKYRNHFPYFFSSTPGQLPRISFSHHANWQKLVPFALFIYLNRQTLDATTSQS